MTNRDKILLIRYYSVIVVGFYMIMTFLSFPGLASLANLRRDSFLYQLVLGLWFFITSGTCFLLADHYAQRAIRRICKKKEEERGT